MFDPDKNCRNVEKHGVSLADAEAFEWKTAIINEDSRKTYPERRFEATGYIATRLHVLIFCYRENHIRCISLRKANLREEKKYAKTKSWACQPH